MPEGLGWELPRSDELIVGMSAVAYTSTEDFKGNQFSHIIISTLHVSVLVDLIILRSYATTRTKLPETVDRITTSGPHPNSSPSFDSFRRFCISTLSSFNIGHRFYLLGVLRTLDPRVCFYSFPRCYFQKNHSDAHPFCTVVRADQTLRQKSPWKR